MFAFGFVILFKIVICIMLKTEIREFSYEVDLLSAQDDSAIRRAFSVQSTPFISLLEEERREIDDCLRMNDEKIKRAQRVESNE